MISSGVALSPRPRIVYGFQRSGAVGVLDVAVYSSAIKISHATTKTMCLFFFSRVVRITKRKGNKPDGPRRLGLLLGLLVLALLGLLFRSGGFSVLGIACTKNQ